MSYFKINDTIHFISTSETVDNGICVNITLHDDGSVKTYDVKTSAGYITNVSPDNAYPSAFSLVSPTPTPSVTPTLTVSPTPKATNTPTMTVTPSPVIHKNLFDLDTTQWTVINGVITADTNKNSLLFKSKSLSDKDSVSFHRDFVVSSGKYYYLNLNFDQGTARYAKISMVSANGVLQQISQTTINSNNTIVFSTLEDSGNLEVIIYIDGTTEVKLMVDFFLDSNFSQPAAFDHTYTFSKPIFRQITNDEKFLLVPSPTVTPSYTATPSPTVTPSSTTPIIPPNGYYNVVIKDNPLIYFKLDELSSSTAIDSSGNNLNGSYSNVTLGTRPIVDGPGYAVSFGSDPSTASYISLLPDYRYQSIAGDFSIELSLNTVSSTGIILLLPSTNGNAFKLYLTNGVLYFDLGTTISTYTLSSNTAINDGVNHLITIVRNGSTITMYDKGTVLSSLGVSGYNLTGNSNMQIGGTIGNSTNNYAGVMDDFSFYKYALSASQITNHAAFWNNSNNTQVTPTPTPSISATSDDFKTSIIRSSPIAYYRLDESSGNVVYDSIGKNNGISNGLLNLQQPSLMPNYSDSSTKNTLDGLISIKDTGSFSFTGSDFTFEFFINVDPAQVDASPIVFGKVIDPTLGTFSYKFGLSISGKGVFTVFIDGQVVSLTTPYSIADSNNRYFAITRNARSLNLYINGYLAASTSLPGTGIISTSGYDLELFSSSTIPNSRFIGTLDEFVIYNFALNPNVIANHYSSAIAVTPSPTPTQTLTPTPTATNTVTPTISQTPSVTRTISYTPSPTLTPTNSPLVSVTPTLTPTMSSMPGGVVKITDGYSNDFSVNKDGFYGDVTLTNSTIQSSYSGNGYNVTDKNKTIVAYLALSQEQTISFSLLNNLSIQTWSYTETVYSTATSNIYLDGVFQQTISFSASQTREGAMKPTATWQQVNILVPPGEHTLTIVNMVPTFNSSQATTYSTVYSSTVIDNVIVGTPLTPTPTSSPTLTPTSTPTITSTSTITPTVTRTVTITPTVTRSVTSTPNLTVTASATPSHTPTMSVSGVYRITDGYTNNFSANMRGFSGATLNTTSYGNTGGSIYSPYLQNGNGTTDSSYTITALLDITTTQTITMDVLNDFSIQVWNGSETIYTTLCTNIYIDGALVKSVNQNASEFKSGPVPNKSWQTVSFDVSAGLHTMTIVCVTPTFSSTDSPSYSYVYTRTVLDNIVLTKSTQITPTPTPTITITPSNTKSPTPTPSSTPTISLTPQISVSVDVTLSATPSATPPVSPSSTPPVSPSSTQPVSPSSTPPVTQSTTPSLTPTLSMTNSIVVSSSVTPTPTPSAMPSVAATTPSVTPTISLSMSQTPGIASIQIESLSRKTIQKAPPKELQIASIKRKVLIKKV